MNAERLLQLYDRVSDAPDAIPRLRRFILDLAVRGKLVEQDLDDEPASALLERIRVEKARLVQSGAIKRPRSSHVSNDEVPFLLPTTWVWTTLGEITSYIQRGKSPKYAQEHGVPVVSQKCVQWTGLDLSVARRITEKSLTAYEEIRFLCSGDLLWNSTGTGTIGRVIRLVDPPAQLVCDSHVTVVRCLLVEPEYVRTWLCSDHVYGLIEGRAAGSTNQVELTAQMANGQMIPLPPLAEQPRIVAKVDELLALCDSLEAEREKREATRDRLTTASLSRLTEPNVDDKQFKAHSDFAIKVLPELTTRPEQITVLRQTILDLAVQGKLVEQDPNDEPASYLLQIIESWGKEAVARKEIRAPRKELRVITADEGRHDLPAGWAEARLGQLIYVRSGAGLTAEAMVPGPIPVFGGNGVTGYHDEANVIEPTVVIGRVGYHCGSIHVTPGKAWVTDNAFITHYCREAINQRYLVLLLMTAPLKEREGATAQPVISGSKIYPIVASLPPLAEQERIVKKVDELSELCSQLETELISRHTHGICLLDALHFALVGA